MERMEVKVGDIVEGGGYHLRSRSGGRPAARVFHSQSFQVTRLEANEEDGSTTVWGLRINHQTLRTRGREFVISHLQS